VSLRARFTERLEEARRVHIDARVLAFHLLACEPFVDLSRLLLEGVRSGRVAAQTSALSIFQLLAEPYRTGAEAAAARVARYVSAFPGLEVVPVTTAVARQAAQVQARLGGRSERSLQIATALAGEADLFVTQGSGLRRIAGMEVLDLEDFVEAGSPQGG
jgi:predicted nucleic acid-binding protein